MIYLPTIFLEIPRNVYTAVGLPLTLGVLSGLPTSKVVKGEWYKNLYKPPFFPPRLAFPIIWPILYISMGYASHLAVRALDSAVLIVDQENTNLAVTLYYAQLAMNFAWTPLFFSAKKTGLALVNVLTLTGTTYFMTATLHNITDGATTPYLAPYCVWLTFATYLNSAIWLHDGSRTGPKKD